MFTTDFFIIVFFKIQRRETDRQTDRQTQIDRETERTQRQREPFICVVKKSPFIWRLNFRVTNVIP